jgi:starch phosphorylase
MNDFYTLPLAPVKDAEWHDLKVAVKLPTGSVFIQVWKLDVGRITLYLLDTNIPENVLPQDRDITDSLYGGDIDTRIRQEIVLGIGGMRALAGHGPEPTVFHMNEGHSAFLALEQVRLVMRDRKLNFDEALEAARASNVFTTHTPVPAGIDLFDPGLMYHYFSEYCAEVGIDFQQLMALGRRNVFNRDERFSMAVLALNTSAYRNAVSRLHREVSQEMFHDLWPQLAALGSAHHLHHQRRAPAELAERRPGVALRSVPAARLARALQRSHHLGAGERHPDEELLEVHRRRKRRLVSLRARPPAFSRPCAARPPRGSAARGEVLDPNAFTIGFARRFATYKRATLLFRDVERLKRILLNKDMPVQIVDRRQGASQGPAREELHPRGRAALPRSRPLEARGLRGRLRHEGRPRDGAGRGRVAQQSAARRRGLRHQRHEGGHQRRAQPEHPGRLVRRSLRNLRRLGHRRARAYSDDQDALHASAIYYLLENEIVPMFYERREQTPREWMRRMKQSSRTSARHSIAAAWCAST